MDTEILNLRCPICGREMKEMPEPSDFLRFKCDDGHESVKVDFSINGFAYVFLGAGCYLGGFDDEISSCEKAIGRMKLEYDCDKFMAHFEERNPWAKV